VEVVVKSKGTYPLRGQTPERGAEGRKEDGREDLGGSREEWRYGRGIDP